MLSAPLVERHQSPVMHPRRQACTTHNANASMCNPFTPTTHLGPQTTLSTGHRETRLLQTITLPTQRLLTAAGSMRTVAPALDGTSTGTSHLADASLTIRPASPTARTSALLARCSIQLRRLLIILASASHSALSRVISSRTVDTKSSACLT